MASIAAVCVAKEAGRDLGLLDDLVEEAHRASRATGAADRSSPGTSTGSRPGKPIWPAKARASAVERLRQDRIGADAATLAG